MADNDTLQAPKLYDWRTANGFRDLLLRCDCGTHVADFTFYVSHENEKDYGDYGYVTFGTLSEERPVWSFWNLKQRLRACWHILRGKEHIFNDVILDHKNTTLLTTYLNDVQSAYEAERNKATPVTSVVSNRQDERLEHGTF